MTEKELLVKIEDLKNDREYLDKLAAQDTPEKIQATFAEKGIELTLEEVKTIIVGVVDSLDNSETLDEVMLENVSGGFVATSTLIGFGCFVLLSATGVAIGWRAARKKC